MRNKKVIRKPLNACKLNRLLDNSEIKEDIKTKIINYLESNEKENTSDYNTYKTHNMYNCRTQRILPFVARGNYITLLSLLLKMKY